MAALRKLLVSSGIAQLPELYTPEQIRSMNAALGPFFEAKIEEKRSYAHASDLLRLGLWDSVFSPAMIDVLFSIMPDPVLYHAHAYEIAANNTKSHIFSESLSGWHRDPDSTFVEGDPSHISLFIYLTHVGPEDGAFEFVPDCPPSAWLGAHDPFISVLGEPGYSFAWHRNYFHRASPNRGSVRRRLIKLSIQRNSFHSAHLSNPYFEEVKGLIPAGNERMDVLLGRYQGKKAPSLPKLAEVACLPINTNQTLDLPVAGILKAQIKLKARLAVDTMRGKKIAQAAYD